MFQTGYGHVEAALVQTYGVPTRAIPTFRSRLGHLQKLGLFGRKNMPGRGAALRYGPDQFHRLIFACELSELGVSPATVLALVEAYWDKKLASIFKKAEDAAEHGAGPNDIITHMGGIRLMTGEWSGDSVVNVNSCRLGDLPKYIEVWMRMGRLPARALIVDLSSRLRQFHAALVDTHPAEIARERVEAKERPKKKKR